ncbi:xanthine dehydrogenase family protein molybdopterin-binding subunit [Halomonas eurihalina]|uniref:Xanthine dehydrogenase family protein molybdopterin-binding subunit n=1 Tax=Halomonas eurihalina TaxID=42566 RepID=A0A5D9CWV8_HALER|nr:xanthine dehydrogenase family protein molybdopterin-binding subunit [Halomonas eurihalina]MDR5860904.1 xanthine dehydrogenase family protein molybdopterin-binding subunit [Halomonas eurihalina]TZG35886.1 xanthine dehydrogenase family protein molybdopterin-binding subunit [Halomonas eurihalina]
MKYPRLSRRAFLKGSATGIGITVAPLGSRAFAALFEPRVTAARDQWASPSGAHFRIDAISKVSGAKVFARDIRARDMPGWPQQQSHAMLLKATRADRTYQGFDLSLLDDGLQPDRIVTSADLEQDGVGFPESHGPDPLLPEGKTPLFLGHPVAILIWHDFARYRAAKNALQFRDDLIRYGAKTGEVERPPYGSFRYVRVGGETPYDPDVFSSLKDSDLFPTIKNRRPVWPDDPSLNGDIGEQGVYHARRMQDTLDDPPDNWEVFQARYTTPYIEPAALEPDNGNGWLDPDTGTLNFVVATQCPFESAHETARMLEGSRFDVRHLNVHPGYTVGYGSKDHNIFVYYAVIAALYGDGHPVRLANDRFEQFQSGIKRHPFDMDYRLAVDRDSLKFQIFRAHMDVNGGGRANYSASVAAVGATAAQSVYYLPRSDLATTAYPSRAVEAGSMRGYGTLQTMAATEMMVDELAERLDVDPIELRRANVLEAGMKNTQGAIPGGAIRVGEMLDKAERHPLWKERTERRDKRQAEDPDHLYGTGFAVSHKDFGTGAEAPMASVEIDAEGRIRLRQIAIDMGTGTATSQAMNVVDFLGRPADDIKTGETDWPELTLETSGNPYTMQQAEQDRLSRNPRWTPRLASPSSASNSAYYSSHATREAARLVFRHGLWPAALSIWGQGIYGGQANPYVMRLEDARWVEGHLTASGMTPIPLAKLAAKAHEMGLVTAASVHAFNRWSWASAEFPLNDEAPRLPLDAVAVKYGDDDYHLLDRRDVRYPDVQLNNAHVTYYSPVATLVDLRVNKGSGEVEILEHYSWVECGKPIVPELVKGQLEGGIAMGIGHALLEEMPLYEDGPGNGTWNVNRYQLPLARHCAVWKQGSEILPPLSDTDPAKGMGEVVMIPIVGAIVNALAHATGQRFRDLPVTPERIKEALHG